MLIELKEIEERYIPFVQIYASDPIIGKTSNVPSPYPENGAEQWYRHVKKNIQNGSSKVFAILFQDEFAGIVSLNKMDIDSRSADVDYWVRADFHGKGIATKAVDIALSQARKLGISNFHSGCLATNVASINVLIKNGFSKSGCNVIGSGKFVGKDFLSMRKSYS